MRYVPNMRILILALLSGIVSGLLFDFDYAVIPGVLFALAISIGSRVRFEKVGVLRVLAFIAASVGANYAAVSSAIFAADAGLSGVAKDVAMGAAGGLVGSLLLSLALVLIFRMPRMRTFSLVTAAGTLAGAAFMLMPHGILAYAIWQTAVGAAIGWVWSKPR
jgi:hypothetical protein